MQPHSPGWSSKCMFDIEKKHATLIDIIVVRLPPFLLPCLLFGRRPLFTNAEYQILNTKYQIPLQLICNQTPRFTIGDCAAGHRADNRDKNRNVLIVPRNHDDDAKDDDDDKDDDGLFTKLCHFVPFFKKFLLICILSEK